MTTSTSPLVTAGTYRIDPARSRVAFVARGGFGLETVKGTFTIRDGEVVIAADPLRSTATTTIDVASFRTGKERRDRDVLAKFLAADTYPTMTFASTGLRRDGAGWQLDGVLTVHGTTVEVALAIVDVKPAGAGFSATATTRIDRYAAGVTTGRGLVRRFLDVTIDVVAG